MYDFDGMGADGGVYQMTTYDQTENQTPQEGPNQLSHLLYRLDPNDRDNHDQRHGRAGAAEAEVTAQMQVTYGSLFAGIGGFDLGFERAGLTCKWQVEIDPFCQKVLAKHWPDVPRFGDVKNVGQHNLEPVDVICGGFPCQPFSDAGNKRGKTDDRYLWPEMLRVIRELKPRWVIGENVSGFINMELENAFSDLETQGYKVEAFVLPACGIGAPHKRDRIWIMAYSNQHSGLWGQWGLQAVTQAERYRIHNGRRLEMSYWEAQHQPSIHRVADGIPAGLDRLGRIGNAVVPQIPEILGRMILQAEALAV